MGFKEKIPAQVMSVLFASEVAGSPYASFKQTPFYRYF
ncbi:hypothetical protein J2Y67_000889 [Neobacillus niacini]|nr:hypothetical protein [Neobacillus niacini]